MSIYRRRFLQMAGGALGGAILGGAASSHGQPLAQSDLVVLIPGIMGSVLRKNQRDVWALSGQAIVSGLRTLGKSVSDLSLSGDDPTREDVGDGIVADRIFPDTHLLPGLWKIDGYSKVSSLFVKALQYQPRKNYFEFPYDWRRDNRVAARRLDRQARDWLRSWRRTSGNANAKLVLVAHSMGGLVARYFLEVLGGWQDTRMLITFGTPYRGSLNAFNSLANGYKKSVGPLTLVDMSALVRSFTSVYQLLPIYPCYDDGTGRLQRVGEANGLPNVDRAHAQGALEFHNEIRRAVETNAKESAYLNGRYTLHPIVGAHQPTLQIGNLVGQSISMSETYPKMEHIRGDGTVPEVSATPIEPESLSKLHRTVFVAEVHGSIQNSQSVLDHIRGLMRADLALRDQFRGLPELGVALSVEDVYAADETVSIRVACKGATAGLLATVFDAATGKERLQRVLPDVGEALSTRDLGRMPEGTYRLRLEGERVGAATDVFVVLQA